MQLTIRSTRSLKATEIMISNEERAHLAQLAMDPRYESLLSVMERACIQLDTAMINCSSGEPESVLGAHCVSKAGWLLFTYFQKQVLNCYNTQPGEQEEVSPPSLNDVLQGVEAL